MVTALSSSPLGIRHIQEVTLNKHQVSSLRTQPHSLKGILDLSAVT